MSDSESKMLRDKITRLVGHTKKLEYQHKSFVKEMSQLVARLKTEIADLKTDNMKLKKVNRYHENPHTPPSQNSLWAQRKKIEAKRNSNPAKPGRKKGHKGVSHSRKSDRTAHHTCKECTKCGSKNIRIIGTMQKQTCDIPKIKITTTTNISHKYSCNSCDSKFNSMPKWMIPGTSFGPNIMALTASLWDTASSIKDITEILDCFEARFCKATVQHALDMSTDRILEPISNKILESHDSSKYIKMDESPYSMDGKRVYAWTCVGDRGVTVMPATSRGMVVLKSHFSHLFDKPITVDGYAAYNLFGTRQRCWSHSA